MAHSAGNFVDVVFAITILLFIWAAAFFVDMGDLEFDSSMIAWGVTVAAVFPTCAAALLIACSLCNHLLHRRQKPIRFFISHLKYSAGSFARLLKMSIDDSQLRAQVYLDVDDPRDLPVRLDLIGKQTHTHTCCSVFAIVLLSSCVRR